jgi:hypothetical protein
MGQLVTGSCVNAVLAVAVLFAGLYSGLTVALVSPILAFLLGIAPQIVTVPAIMLGNAAFILVLHFVAGKFSKNIIAQIVAWVSAAAVKFGVLYAIVVWLICDVLSESLLANGALKAPMLKVLPVNFGITQLFTALIGGGVALAIAPVLRKALKK